MGTTSNAAQNRKKPRGRPFAPGNNANPGGRPKLPDDVKHVRELAREYTGEAVKTLATVMKTGSPNARVSAANSLIDRGWGKPEQSIVGAGDKGEIVHKVELVIVDPAS